MTAAALHGLAPFAPRAYPEAAAALKALSRLTEGGFTTMFAGGAVRDALLGRIPHDFDLATVAVPNQVMHLLAADGFRFAMTGIEHGTVMAFLDRQQVEITTLRKDVETDGRRAKVAFTNDWVEDASRRDLTMNALYADADGAILDLVGGLADLVDGVVRFVGDPNQRVAEDALRILRFFRFHAWYGAGPCEPEGLAACICARETLARLSGERIWSELQRLLIAPAALETLTTVLSSGILEPVAALPLSGLLHFGALDQIERAHDKLCPVRRLALLLDCPDAASAEDMASAIAQRLKLSRANSQRLGKILMPPAEILDERGLLPLLHYEGRDLCRDWLWLAAAKAGLSAVPAQLDRILENWQPKPFPLTGSDLLAAGVPPGPGMGQLLSRLEDWWVRAERTPDREACLRELLRLKGMQGN